jgi:hypothetical protein
MNRRAGLIIQDIRDGIAPAQRPANLSDENLWVILESCWRRNPDERIHARQILDMFKEDGIALD